MKSKMLSCIRATALGAAIISATPALAFRGGGGFGGGGTHIGGGGMHFGGMPFAGGSFRGGMFTGRSVFVPGAGRFAGAPFPGQAAMASPSTPGRQTPSMLAV